MEETFQGITKCLREEEEDKRQVRAEKNIREEEIQSKNVGHITEV